MKGRSTIATRILPHLRAAGFFVLGLSAGSMLMTVGMFVWEQYEHSVHVEAEVSVAEPSGVVLPASEPITLRIPSIGIDAPFTEPLGVNDDGTVEVPSSFTSVGRYEHGPIPGEYGPAVVLGHIDSYEGPAVFFSLGQLEPGDEIFIEREDGTTATFIVDGLKRYPRDQFPTDAVYGDLEYAGLRLITCSGTYDRGKRVYSHNLVVFAHLSEPNPQKSEENS